MGASPKTRPGASPVHSTSGGSAADAPEPTPYKGFDSVLAEAKDDAAVDKAHRKMKYEQYVQVQVRGCRAFVTWVPLKDCDAMACP